LTKYPTPEINPLIKQITHVVKTFLCTRQPSTTQTPPAIANFSNAQIKKNPCPNKLKKLKKDGGG
jgi:hypothetical protein